MAHFSLVETRSQNLQKKLCSPSNCLPTLDFLFTAELRSLSHSDAGCEELVSDVSSVKEGGVKTPQFHVEDTIPCIALFQWYMKASKGYKSMWGTQFHDFLHNIGSVALEHEDAGVKRLQFHEKYIITHTVPQ